MKTDQVPSPQRVVADASKYLHTLVRLYYIRHGCEAMDLFLVIPLMVAGFECIGAMDEQTPVTKLETLRSTLILVAKGLSNQRQESAYTHPPTEGIFLVGVRPLKLFSSGCSTLHDVFWWMYTWVY
jgi:hypothetical protein